MNKLHINKQLTEIFMQRHKNKIKNSNSARHSDMNNHVFISNLVENSQYIDIFI